MKQDGQAPRATIATRRRRLGAGALALVAVLTGGFYLARPRPEPTPPAKAAKTSVPAPWSGRGVLVADGDTFRVQHGLEHTPVRLHGIDCPERSQPHGPEARARTAELVLHRDITVLPVELDRYGRVVARVQLADGRDLAQTLVDEGHAWWYREHAMSDAELCNGEAKAKAAKLGLWAKGDAQAPWEYRRALREKAAAK